MSLSCEKILRYLTFVVCICLFIIFPVNAFAEDSENLELGIKEIKIISVTDYRRHHIVDGNIAEVSFKDNNLIIKGLKIGNTSLYLWEGEILKPFLIEVKMKELPIKTNFRKIIIKNGNISSPTKFVFKSTYQNNGINLNNNTFNQVFSNSIDFKTPLNLFSSGNLKLFADVFNKMPASNINDVSLRNISLNYSEKNLYANLGDSISTIKRDFLKKQFISEFSGIRGAEVEYRPFEQIRFNFLGGAERGLQVFSNPLRIQKRYLWSGGIDYNLTKDFALESNILYLNQEAKTNPVNLSFGLKYKPIENFSFNGEFFSNFSKIGFNLNGFYKYAINDDKFVSLKGNWNNFQKDYYDFKYALLQSRNFQIDSNIIPRTNLSFIYKQSSLSFNQTDSNSFGFRTSTNFTNDFNLYSDISLNYIENSSLKTNLNSFKLGTIINPGLPIDLGIGLTNYSSGNNGILSLKTRLFGDTDYSVSVSQEFNLNVNGAEKKLSGISNSMLSLDWKFYDLFRLNTGFSYILRSDDKYLYSYFMPRALFTYKFNDSHSINLNLNSNFSPQNQLSNALINYTYKFNSFLQAQELFGELSGKVFSDDNGNGIFDNGEQTFDNVLVKLEDKGISTSNGEYRLNHLNYGEYIISLEKETVPSGFRQLFPDIKVNISSENNNVDIPVTNLSGIKGIVYGNADTQKGLKDVRVVLDDNDSYITDEKGFYFFRLKAGPHKLKIDYNSIPPGYIAAESISKNIDVNFEEQNIYFKLKPLISVTGSVFIDTKGSGRYQKGDELVSNISLKLTLSDKDENILNESNVITDQKGNFSIPDISPGTLRIKADFLKEELIINIPDEPANMEIYVPLFNPDKSSKKKIRNRLVFYSENNFVANNDKNQKEFIIHKVKSGENLSLIAEKYFNGYSFINYILLYNPGISNKNTIKPGTILKIPTMNFLQKTFGMIPDKKTIKIGTKKIPKKVTILPVKKPFKISSLIKTPGFNHRKKKFGSPPNVKEF